MKVVLIVAFVLSLALVMVASAQESDLQVPDEVAAAIGAQKADTKVYIAMMDGAPVVAYDGGKVGLASTRPENDKKINPNSARVKRYVQHQNAKHNAALASVGAAKNKVYDYNFAFNGFAAVLTEAQAKALKARPDVLMVWQDELRQLETDNSPDFLGLTAEGGLWDTGYTGEDVIIGVIDTGAWPEHPSFSDQLDLSDAPGNSGKRSLAYGPPPADWYGDCQSGERWSQDDCNNKLIGARYFKDGFTNNDINISKDFLSARDKDGHGSHTASTAGGNAGVEASIFGVDRGVLSGMAPRARIAVYKACWADAGCAGSDLTMAIDQAVADGVDVINYSIGSSATSLASDDIAFLFAADAGVFVATSNGNSGPDAGTTGSPAWDPWLTSVGASTQDRTFLGSASSSDGWEFFGASITGSTDGELMLVDAEDAGDELCTPGALDPALVAGNVVLCRRGVFARVEKSHAVYLAGGAGMILYNAFDTQSQVTDNHWVPSVHINNSDGMTIKAYIDSTGTDAVAMINGGEFATIPAPWMASFSSRGPNGGAPDVIKPDITAPGVNILAANSPVPFLGMPGQLFQSISGTSMSSPHVAGIFALLKEAHPDWSPAAAKSAIMTTAYQDVMKEDGVTPADPFDMGAGHLNPNPAVDPGLVYDAGFFDYLAFLCGNNPANIGQGTCDFLAGSGYSLDPSQLNLPSIGVADLAGSEMVTRTVTSVTPVEATYTASFEAPPGVDVVVDPPSLTLLPGESAAYAVTFTNVSAALDEWVFGGVTWSHGPHVVRIPVALKPVKLSAPAEVHDSGVDGSLSFDVTFGYTGAYTAAAHGLVPADMQPDNVVDDPANDINVALGTGVGITWHEFEVPAGSAYVRFSLFDEYTDGIDDLDLYVWDPDGFFFGSSGSGTSAEEVNGAFPAPGVYFIAVHGWQTDGPDANYTLFNWAFGPDEGNMTVTGPAAAVLGDTGTVDVDWVGLDAGTRYLGAVSHSDAGGAFDMTVLRIDTD